MKRKDNLRNGITISIFLLILIFVCTIFCLTFCRDNAIEPYDSAIETTTITSITAETSSSISTETTTEETTSVTTLTETTSTTTTTPVTENTTTITTQEVTTSQLITTPTTITSVLTTELTGSDSFLQTAMTTTETTALIEQTPSGLYLQFVKTFNHGTYYAYGEPRCGGSGRQLIDCITGEGNVKGSIASRYLYENYGYNYNGKRTLVYLEVEDYPTMDGYYYLDDSNAAGYNDVIDFFFLYDYNCPFELQGVVKVDCYIVL